jgi:hypothetical protein
MNRKTGPKKVLDRPMRGVGKLQALRIDPTMELVA